MRTSPPLSATTFTTVDIMEGENFDVIVVGAGEGSSYFL
jgi:hypothetical protein